MSCNQDFGDVGQGHGAVQATSSSVTDLVLGDEGRLRVESQGHTADVAQPDFGAVDHHARESRGPPVYSTDSSLSDIGHTHVDDHRYSADAARKSECGQSVRDAQEVRAAQKGGDLRSHDTQWPDVSAEADLGEGGHLLCDAHSAGVALSPICDNLRELHRQRQDLHRAEKGLTLQIKAKCRRLCGGSKTEADKLYRAMFPKKKKSSETAMERVKPTIPFVASDDENGGGHYLNDTQHGSAPSQPNGGHTSRDAQSLAAAESNGGGHAGIDSQVLRAPSIDDLLPAALAVSIPFIQARSTLEPERKETEKRMAAEAKKLPVWSGWCEEMNGFGIGSLAAIVGETGNISQYSTVSKLWKRLGIAVINGERQRKKTNKEEAIEHGYNPSRRSVMWNVRETIFKAQSMRVDKETGEILRPAGEYRMIYDERKAYEIERDPEMKPIHAHRRAMRYMEKRLVRDLWRAWRDCGRGQIAYDNQGGGAT